MFTFGGMIWDILVDPHFYKLANKQILLFFKSFILINIKANPGCLPLDQT